MSAAEIRAGFAAALETPLSRLPAHILVLPEEPRALCEIAMDLGDIAADARQCMCWLAEDEEDGTAQHAIARRLLPHLREAQAKLHAVVADLLLYAEGEA